jgi:hypothetical protein
MEGRNCVAKAKTQPSKTRSISPSFCQKLIFTENLGNKMLQVFKLFYSGKMQNYYRFLKNNTYQSCAGLSPNVWSGFQKFFGSGFGFRQNFGFRVKKKISKKQKIQD